MFEFEEVRRVSYDFGGEFGMAVFVPVCPCCGRFVAAKGVTIDGEGEIAGHNAECSRCGPVEMPFEGYF